MKRKAKTYTISAVANQYGLHAQTLRLYEREGLLKPSRSEGNTRLYTDTDLERLELILMLTAALARFYENGAQTMRSRASAQGPLGECFVAGRFVLRNRSATRGLPVGDQFVLGKESGQRRP